MDSILELNKERDARISEAFELVNKKKRGYIYRRPCQYVESSVANVIFSSVLTQEEILQNMSVSTLIRERKILKAYRSYIPYFWEKMNEWILVIVDTEQSSISIIYCRFEANVSLSKARDRQQLNDVITPRMQFVLMESSRDLPNVVTNVPPSQEPLLYCRAQWTLSYQDPDAQVITTSEISCRTPLGMNGRISAQASSGVYIAYALECDYYDAPIYAENDHWENIRRYLAYCILNNEPLFMS